MFFGTHDTFRFLTRERHERLVRQARLDRLARELRDGSRTSRSRLTLRRLADRSPRRTSRRTA
jgi:hypothetical protein